MRRFTEFANTWWAGPMGALLVLAVAALASLDQGFSLKTGPVEMTMDLSPDQGLQIRFAQARQ